MYFIILIKVHIEGSKVVIILNYSYSHYFHGIGFIGFHGIESSK